MMDMTSNIPFQEGVPDAERDSVMMASINRMTDLSTCVTPS